MPDTEAAPEPRYEYASVWRSKADERVWMCNIPYLDIADGIVATASLRLIKAYVEENSVPGGTWERVEDGGLEYRFELPPDGRLGTWPEETDA